jgi:hypothetical protein
MDISLEYVSVLGVRIPEDGNGLPEMLSMVIGEFEQLREISREVSCLVISSLILALARPERQAPLSR